MGLYLYFAKSTEWATNYNCSFYSPNDVPLSERQHRPFAALLILLFIIYELLYIPCLYAMLQKDLRRSFCYKLMIEMAIIDMANMWCSALFSGLFSWNGWAFCHFPRLSYLAGNILFPLWLGYCLSCVILAINRCASITNKYSSAFTGHFRQTLWLAAAPTLILFVAVFCNSIIYNSIKGAWFFNPHMGYFPDPPNKYVSVLQLPNNLLFCILIPSIYVVFFLKYRKLQKQRTQPTSRREMQLLIQTFIINLTMTVSAAGYMTMQFVPVPHWVVAFSHIVWILVEGAPPVVYLTMNSAIRKALFGKRLIPESVGSFGIAGRLPSGSKLTV